MGEEGIVLAAGDQARSGVRVLGAGVAGNDVDLEVRDCLSADGFDIDADRVAVGAMLGLDRLAGRVDGTSER